MATVSCHSNQSSYPIGIKKKTPLFEQGEVGLIFVFRFSFFAFRFLFFVFHFSFFDIRTESENPILIFKILFWHSHWVGKSYFDIQNPILSFALSRKILFWSFAPSRKILFWYIKIGFSDSVRMSKEDFECQNTFFRLSSNVKIGFWISK